MISGADLADLPTICSVRQESTTGVENYALAMSEFAVGENLQHRVDPGTVGDHEQALVREAVNVILNRADGSLLQIRVRLKPFPDIAGKVLLALIDGEPFGSTIGSLHQ